MFVTLVLTRKKAAEFLAFTPRPRVRKLNIRGINVPNASAFEVNEMSKDGQAVLATWEVWIRHI